MKDRARTRVALSIVVAGGLLAAGTPAAQAATVGYTDDGETIVFAAAAGETNDVALTKDPEGLTVADGGSGVLTATGDDCWNVLPRVVQCDWRDLGSQAIELQLGDGADRAGMVRAAVGESSIVPYVFLHAYGGDGDDRIATTEFANLHGGTGDDTLLGDGSSHVLGGDGDDTLRGLFLLGGDGDDVLTATGFQGHVDPGPGADTISSGDASQARLTYARETTPVAVSVDGQRNDGPDGLDLIGPGFEVIEGGSAADRFEGGPGDDGFQGGPGDDVLRGNAGNDWLDGGDGDDALGGGAGDDRLMGNSSGRDVMDGGAGADTMGGGSAAGHDVISYAGRDAPVHVTNEQWNFLRSRGEGDDGAPGEHDLVIGAEEIIGGAGADVLVGFDGPETLVGGEGEDVLDGADGADTLLIRDRLRDAVACGDGADVLTADRIDEISADCERVRRGRGPGHR